MHSNVSKVLFVHWDNMPDWTKVIFVKVDLGFNIAHSKGYLLVVLAKGWQIGVDLEKSFSDQNFSAIAPLIFSEAEHVLIAGAEDPLLSNRFS
jgi:phosphopantetheinyl transferase